MAIINVGTPEQELLRRHNGMRTIEHEFYAHKKVNVWQRFLHYATSQERNKLGLLAFALALQGCVLAPLTFFAIVSTGNSMVLWGLCIFSFAATEVTNLAALPTKITIPVLFAGILIDLLVIATTFILY